MADTQDPAAGAPQSPQQLPQVKMLAHYVRDLSFENVGVMQGTPAQGKPEIGVQVHLDGSPAGEGTYQLNLKITAKSQIGDKTRYLVELDYGGVFSIENAPESHIHPLLYIECPRQLLPFARRVVSDVTRDGGYSPLLLDNIDFATLYRQKLEELRRKSGQGAGQGAGQGGAAAAGSNGNGQAAAAPEGGKAN